MSPQIINGLIGFSIGIVAVTFFFSIRSIHQGDLDIADYFIKWSILFVLVVIALRI